MVSEAPALTLTAPEAYGSAFRVQPLRQRVTFPWMVHLLIQIQVFSQVVASHFPSFQLEVLASSAVQPS